MDNNEVDYIKKQTPDAFLEKAKKHGWICPKCNNGNDKNGIGIVLNPKTRSYNCYKCNFEGDILDLIGRKFNLSDYNEQFQKATEIYDITPNKCKTEQNLSLTAEQKQHTIKTISEVADISQPTAIHDYIAKCHASVSQTDYFSNKGITQASIDSFQLGYDPDFHEETASSSWKAIIIPTSTETYEARNTAETTKDGNQYLWHGGVKLFNISSLNEEKKRPIFICKDIIDAISLIQCGCQAIGLGNSVNYRCLLSELDKITPAKPLILIFDADESGKGNAYKFVSELEKKSIPFIITTDLMGNYNSVNDRMLKDSDGLHRAIAKVYADSSEVSDPLTEAKSEYLKTSAGKSLKDFMKSIQATANRPQLSTGFKHIDDALDGGIYTGLYIIGAMSSLGKTTLTLQIADNLAKQGRDVLIFSLEQSKFELMAKSISRETFLYCQSNNLDTRYAKSYRDITDGHRWANYNETEKRVINESWKSYSKYAKHVFIFEGIGNISVAEIRNRIKAHISLTGNKRPVIFIDYLQILRASKGDERNTDKQIVDHNVTALKQLSRDFDIPIIAVSSLNRQNYNEKINMGAFKESGAIEYGSDVLIGLQFTGTNKNGFDADKAREKNPRKIDFCILKNRNGKTTSTGLPMTFFQTFNYFKPSNE